MSVPNVTVTSAWTAAPVHLPGIGVDAARQIDGDHQGARPRGQLAASPASVAAGVSQATMAADPGQAIDDQVGAGDRAPGAAAT